MAKSSFYRIVCIIFTLFHITLLGAEQLEVDRNELANIGNESINFINYIGPYDFTNTLNQIREIGRTLGSQMDLSQSGKASVGSKYSVLHIISPDIPEGFDADVFILESDAAVDHIANIRTILAGYLETMYGFEEQDAYLLAEFTTYYNAAYRGDATMVAKRYKAPVSDVLTPQKIGLDTHYSNWAGQTEMLIPLSGDASAPRIDTVAITDEKVIEEMRQETDMGLDARRDIVELQEEDLEEEQAALDIRQKEVEQREKAIIEELKSLEKKEAANEISPAEEERKKTLNASKSAIEDEKAITEDIQQNIDERTDAVMQMREDIASDENILLENTKNPEEASIAASPVTPVWFLTVDDAGDGIPFGRVVKYNLTNGDRLAVSRMTAIRGRRMAIFPNSLLVIAGKGDNTSQVLPMLLNRDTLEVQSIGQYEIFPGSLMTVREEQIYLVTMKDGAWHLGRFDSNLERKAVSEVVVEPWTSISFEENALFVQEKGGNIIQLSASDLREEVRLESSAQ